LNVAFARVFGQYEVSRFARNSRDWQQLIEVCRIVDTLSQDNEQLIGQLHEKIGQLSVEVDWLKKKCKQLGL
jgi:hypothetical protein